MVQYAMGRLTLIDQGERVQSLTTKFGMSSART
jgi:hypothetical protein